MSKRVTALQPSFDVRSYLRLLGLTTIIAIVVTLAVGMLFHSIQLLSLAVGIRIDRFEDAPLWHRSLLPLVGFLLLTAYAQIFHVDGRDVGIPHTLNRMANHDGDLPWRNAFMQFISAITALGAGFSGGRDGPGLHIGAWLGSTIQSRLQLNRAEADLMIRVGMTAAMAAGFHTPFAAVIFVSTITKNGPMAARNFPILIVAAVLGNVLAIWLGIDQLTMGDRVYNTLAIDEWLIVTALAIPVLFVGVANMRLVVYFTRVRGPFFARLLTITMMTAGLAMVFPDALGLGYDTFEGLLRSDASVGLGYLLLFVTIKLLLTSTSVAFGVPLGVIGPTLVTGAAFGALCYTTLSLTVPELISAPVGVYALLGATTMLGTVFNTPFAATVLFLELTMNLWLALQVALPILLAHECKIKFWSDQSIFEARLAAQGISLRSRNEPI